MTCPNCGGTLCGDGYTLALHCELVDITDLCLEPDSQPTYCTPETE